MLGHTLAVHVSTYLAGVREAVSPTATTLGAALTAAATA
jgi:hypothetical protein